MVKVDFSIIVKGKVYQVGDIVSITLYDTSNQYDFLYQAEDKPYEKVCTGRIAELTTEEITLDCSEKYQSSVTTCQLPRPMADTIEVGACKSSS